MTTMFTKCRMESCSRKVVPGSYYCAHPDCVRLREALAKRTAPPGKRETGPIVSRDEETAKAASKPTQSEVLAAVQATQASTLPRAPEPLDLGDLDEEDDEFWRQVNEFERKLLTKSLSEAPSFSAAARDLGMEPWSLRRLCKRLGIEARVEVKL